ncbi:MAG: electron transfer flavoprotein subunit alpha/FixB family protein [Candidatus Binatia bacterium]
MKRDIFILTEHWAGEVDTITYQMLTKGRQLADGLGVELVSLVLGHHLGSITATLQDKGMDTILVVDDLALAQASVDTQAHIIAEVVRQTEPRLVLIGYNLVGMELAPAIATKLGVAAVTNCVNIELLDNELVVTRPLFDGTMHAKIALEGSEPAVVAIQKGTATAMQLSAKEASVHSFPIDVKSIPSRIKVLEITEEPVTELDITKADIIVSVGRGIGDKEKIGIIQELADALGGVVACSRPIVDVGWLPRERQVGASGKSVAPKVYIACGISGASQHLSGMSDSKRIIAINKDANAPIFQVAHYGVVASLFDLVPALTEEAKKGHMPACQSLCHQ